MNSCTIPPSSFQHYTQVVLLSRGARTEVYRAVQQETDQSVVVKVMCSDHPSFSELLQFRNQYAIAYALHHANIVTPITLERYGNGYALIMPNEGFVSLPTYWEQQQYNHTETVAAVLAIALQLTDALHYLIGQRIIHKDIKSANILIHPDTQQVQLIDFSIASRLPREQQELANPNVLEGTLAYLSPEQTGRMNRGIDYRSDFYALGVTLYELLTGALPFPTDDPMTLVHHHITTQPPVAHGLNPEVPPILSEILVKLMAKNAEDRYQSASGLKYDLEHCRDEWQKKGTQIWFQLGERDVSDRFLIPEKLYGRHDDIMALLAAFNRASAGHPELMLVAGFSGIGKTAVINEVHKPITRQNGYFIKGKFDQFNRSIPFSAVVQAFRRLIGQLLGESDTALERWKKRILEAVGINGQLILEVIPELTHIIGKQPALSELSGSAALNRFQLVFSKFVQVFTTKEHPLVIFLDDLQWADLASLNLLKMLMDSADTGHLLVLGAYRDNEVFPAHPLMLMVDDLQKQGATIQTLTLAPLTQSDINHLVADTLWCSDDRAEPLAELVYSKTLGNPFFTTQFLYGLHTECCIIFNYEMGYWQCDLARIRQLALTDNVVKFMVRQLKKLPAKTQEILKLAACIGNQFDLETLAIVYGAPNAQNSIHAQESVAIDLWQALNNGLVIPENETYKFFQQADQHPSPNTLTASYRFLHDRVQQAAYSLIPDSEKSSLHLKIGQRLLTQAPAQAQDDMLFAIVGQLNMGHARLTNRAERHQLAQLNLRAGRKAKLSTAYSAAANYLTVACQLLTPDCWQQDYPTTLNIFVEALEADYLNTHFDQIDTQAVQILSQVQTVLDGIKVYEVQIRAAVGQGNQRKALEIGLSVLERLEVSLLADKPDPVVDVTNLAEAPAMTDPHKLAAMAIMAYVVTPAWSVSPDTFRQVTFTMVDLSLNYGNCAASAFGYVWYGTLLCEAFGNIDEGYEFGRLSIALLDRFDARTFRSKILNLYASHILFWKEHLTESLGVHLEGLQSGLDTGDLEFASYCAAEYSQYLLLAGVPLDSVQEKSQQKLSLIQRFNQRFHIDYLAPVVQGTLNLLGVSESLTNLQGAIYDERDRLPELVEQKQLTTVFVAYLIKSMLSYFFGDVAQAVKDGQRARDHSGGVTGTFFIPVELFYSSLAQVACWSGKEPSQQDQPSQQDAEREQVEACLAKLKHWATHAPMNYQHKCDLLEAELAYYDHQFMTAIESYDRAIAGAKVNKYLHEEALANELAAKFYLNWGKEKVAAGYMQEAYYCYARWGSKAKTDHLEQRYPHLLKPIFQAANPITNPSVNLMDPFETIAPPNLLQYPSGIIDITSTISFNTALDFDSILKTGQAIAEIIELDELLQRLVQIILENSGGDRCVLVLPNEGHWDVRAIAIPGRIEQCKQPLTETVEVPAHLIYYVKNTQTVVAIHGNETELPFADDYLTRHQPQSALGLPLINQGNLVGVLYLHNQASRNVFTGDRITTLNVLCAQAASSLAKAQLYHQAQRNAAQLKRSLIDLGHSREELLNNECTMRKQALALIELSQHPSIAQGDVDAAFKMLTEVTALTLDIERASIWLFDQSQTQIKCADLFLISTQQHSSGGVLKVDDHLAYFAAISADTIVAVTDAWKNAATKDFRHGYLDTFDIASMLDASFHMDCQIQGVLRCEQVGQKREWSQADQNFVRSAASLIALTLEAERHQKKSEALGKALADLKTSQLQIVQSEKMSALGNLVAGVAHEINNPLGFVSGNISELQLSLNDIIDCLQAYRNAFPNPGDDIQELLEDTELDFVLEDLPKMLGSMKSGCDRIRAISTGLRIFSRADTESTVMANIHEGLDSTLLILKYRLKSKDCRPEIQIIKNYGELPEIQCFPGQLNQVFMNILANAIDMFDEMAEEQFWDTVQTHPQTIIIQTQMTASNDVTIRIRDNGKGMPEDICGKIFDRTFTTKEVGKGTGLGLAIAHQVVTEKHYGTLTVSSQIGQGTEFCICLPCQ